MNNTKWFDRKFAFDFGPDQYAAIYDRLKKAPDILKNSLIGIPEDRLVQKPDNKWSIKEHAGHLSILEPVWRIRFQDIQENKPMLTAVDLNNTATTETGFNGHTVAALLEKFTAERSLTLALLDSMDANDETRTSLHPRLQQPMRMIDLAHFVAEHDLHHIACIREIAAQ